MALEWKKWVLEETGLEKKQKETTPLKQFHLFPNLAQELQDSKSNFVIAQEDNVSLCRISA